MSDEARRNTMLWMERCYPDLEEKVRTGRSDFVEAYVEALRRAIQHAP
jgi:hypothetical protein